MTCSSFEVPPEVPVLSCVPIGRPIANSRCYVLDSRGERVPVGIAGELYVGGIGVGRGYVHQPGLTAERFVPNPFARGERLYRPGDRVRWLAEGILEFQGRLDYQLKIRGYRIEPGEIESVIREDTAISEVVVVSRELAPDDQCLVAYLVRAGNASLDVEALRGRLRKCMPAHMVPSIFTVLERLPLTPNGKVDRKGLPPPDARLVGAVYEAPCTPLEQLLSEIWQELLQVRQVGRHDSFFDLGGHSLLVIRVVANIRERLRVELPLRSVFETPRLFDLAKRLEQQVRESAGVAVPALSAQVREGHVPLSYAQERLRFLEHMGLPGAAYSVSTALRLEGPLDVSALERSVGELIRRHESLRTRFELHESEAVQRIDAAVPSCALKVNDLSSLPIEERAGRARELQHQEQRSGFDLQAGPLFLARVLSLQAEEHVLLLTMHHIITDGWSLGIVVRELSALYEAYTRGQESPLPEPQLQYADYALWQRKWLQGEVLQKQLGYWMEHLQGVQSFELPTDHRRPAVQSYQGALLPFELTQTLSEQLQGLARAQGATLFMVLLAGIQVLLSCWSGQRDIVVGSPIAGRTHQRTEELVGFFVNMLALRTHVLGQMSFEEVVRAVKEVTLSAYAHQDVPFEKVVETLQSVRDLSRQPLFQVVFTLQNAPRGELVLPGLKLRTLGSAQVRAKFVLLFALQPTAQGLLRGFVFAP